MLVIPMTSNDKKDKNLLSDTDKKKARMQELSQQTAKIAWSEMQRFFARGSAIFVDAELDLIETAAELSLDNKAALGKWMRQGKVAPVNDQQAKLWLEHDTVVWAVVLAPWVLVQPIE